MLSSWLFLKLVSLSYFFAFLSLRMQVMGLFGKNGILPIQNLIDAMKKEGKAHFFQLPTILTHLSSDRALKALLEFGIILSIVAFLDLIPFLPFGLLFLLYFSFFTVSYPFLSYQWDCLLLETGFAAMFVSVMTVPPIFIQLWLTVLVFRLMLSSGLVKWFSGCNEWRSFKALLVHFETQPLPNIGGYYANALPKKVLMAMTFLVFIFEIPIPFLYFGVPEAKAIGGILGILLQILIAITGNYAFFNLLTIALHIPLFDDRFLSFLAPIAVTGFKFDGISGISLFLNGIGVLMVTINLLFLLTQFLNIPIFPKAFLLLRRFGIISPYGLFARMTTYRDEIVIEGSHDGIIWETFEFRYKPGQLNVSPKQIAPFQPRLDWQMWFAALSDFRREGWFQRFIYKLLEGSSEVNALLLHNPFQNTPPRFIRAKRYRYHFTTLEERKQSGNFWKKEELGLYLPQVRLEGPNR